VTNFAGDLIFGLDCAEIGEEFLHPVFGKTVVESARHGVEKLNIEALSHLNGCN
jgi:hypothetical protein